MGKGKPPVYTCMKKINGHLSEQETRCQGQKDDTKKIIRKKRKIEMFPLASMPLSSDSSGNQNTKFIPAIDTPKKMKTQNAYVRPDAGRGYLGDTRGLVGIRRWLWCTKDHKNF